MKRKLTLACVTSGEGALLQTVINAQRLGILPFTLVTVLANQSCYGLERASKSGIKSHLIDFKSYASRREFDRAFNGALRQIAPDIVLLNYNKLLSKEIVREWMGRIVNTHFSALPSFPGLNPIAQALESGARYAGVSTHFVDEGMDTGPIISQAVVPVTESHDVHTLGKDLFKCAVPLQLQALSYLSEGRIDLDGARVRIRKARPGVPPFSPGLEGVYAHLPDAVWNSVWD